MGLNLAHDVPCSGHGEPCTNKQGTGGNALPWADPRHCKEDLSGSWKSKKSTFNKTFSANYTSAEWNSGELMQQEVAPWALWVRSPQRTALWADSI